LNKVATAFDQQKVSKPPAFEPAVLFLNHRACTQVDLSATIRFLNGPGRPGNDFTEMTIMSEANQAPTLPDPQTAINTLFNQVSSQVFFQKLASYGYAPRTPQEAHDMMELAGQLRLLDQEQAQKAASDNPYGRLVGELNSAMAQHGYRGAQQAQVQEHELAVKSAASRLMQSPAIYNSVLSIEVARAMDQQPQN
jgi:hypothetical protein